MQDAVSHRPLSSQKMMHLAQTVQVTFAALPVAKHRGKQNRAGHTVRMVLMSEFESHLEAARGWLLLGSPEEANRELGGIKEAHRLDPPVLMVRAGVFQALEDWTRLQTVARLLCDAQPLDPQWPLSLALATRHLEGPVQAIGILMDAIQAFSNVLGAFYDLACCEAATGNLDLARGWLKKAFRLDPGFREKALDDPDLTMLRAEL